MERGNYNHGMTHWPHAPLHIFDKTGTYMITAGTFYKQHLFNDAHRLQFLQDLLLELADEHGWELKAWAIFSNHYHFIVRSESDPESLKKMIYKLHRKSAIWLNKLDDQSGRKVWHQFWDSQITFHNSYMARLRYVNQNPVKHKLVEDAIDYDYCSAAWFEKHVPHAFKKSVESFNTDQVNVYDPF